MAINFPNNPSVDDIFTAPTGIVYKYDGVKWAPTAGGPSNDIELNSLGVGTPASGVSGEIVATGDVTAHFSDDRLKTRLGIIESALEKINTLEGFYYEPNEIAEGYGYEKERRVGLSAQDVQKILPEVVRNAPIGDEYLTLQYDQLVPLIIEAIKELKSESNDLKKKI